MNGDDKKVLLEFYALFVENVFQPKMDKLKTFWAFSVLWHFDFKVSSAANHIFISDFLLVYGFGMISGEEEGI